MAKFTIHYTAGVFSGYSFRDKQAAIDKCKLIETYATVQEEYKAPSPFNPKKITLHGKEIFCNKN